MLHSPDVMRLRILLAFLNDDETCTVGGIARTLNEPKQTISRYIIAMEKSGLLDRSNSRHPVLTEEGRKQANIYGDKINVIINYLMHEGLNIQSAKNDAYLWALYNSEDTMKMIRKAEGFYRIKEKLKGHERFSGSMICQELDDGEYYLPFVIYKGNFTNGNNISMANNGFEHPCILSVLDGVGSIQLKATQVKACSASTGEKMHGIIKNLKYYDYGDFITAENSGVVYSIPASVLEFIHIGDGFGHKVHGSVFMKMQCSAGKIHMPESIAAFTITF